MGICSERPFAEEAFRSVGLAARLLVLYVLRDGPGHRIPGLRLVQLGELDQALWPVTGGGAGEALEDVLRELEGVGLLEREEEHPALLRVPPAPRWAPAPNPNQVRGWRKAWEQLPAGRLRVRHLGDLYADLVERGGKGSGTLAEGFLSTFKGVEGSLVGPGVCEPWNRSGRVLPPTCSSLVSDLGEREVRSGDLNPCPGPLEAALQAARLFRDLTLRNQPGHQVGKERSWAQLERKWALQLEALVAARGLTWPQLEGAIRRVKDDLVTDGGRWPGWGIVCQSPDSLARNWERIDVVRGNRPGGGGPRGGWPRAVDRPGFGSVSPAFAGGARKLGGGER